MRRRTDREKRKTLAKEGVPGINDLDVSPFLFLRVLEGGIKLIARLITSTKRHYLRSCTPFLS
jgi:hypothetical protein